MGQVTLYPGHLIARWYQDVETVWPASIEDLLPFLFYSLTLDPDFTFGDLIALVDRNDIGLLNGILGEQVEPILAEAKREPAAQDAEPVHFLRVSNKHEDGYLRREFDGWGTWIQSYADAEGEAGPRDGWVSLSLMPVNQFLHAPLRYDPALTFRNRANEVEYQTTINITLIEFLKAIFDDLTFYGSPDERDATRDEIHRRLHEIDRGEATLIPWEEVRERLRNRFHFDEDG
jgi:putative addiction module component (TIGR02574 family)